MESSTLSGRLPKRNSIASFALEKRQTIIEIISALFILLFVYTATSKLFDWESFRNVLWRSPLIGSKATFITFTIPIVELLVSSLFLIPGTRAKGLYAATGLMAFFTLYIGYMLVFTENLPCSCGGVISQMNWTQHLLFNIFFAVLGFIAVSLARKKPKG